MSRAMQVTDGGASWAYWDSVAKKNTQEENETMETMDPVSVTAYLRDLIGVFVEELDHGQPLPPIPNDKQSKALDNCFQLFLGRSPTEDEKKRILPW